MEPYVCLMNKSNIRLVELVRRAKANQFSKIAIPLEQAERAYHDDLIAWTQQNEVMFTACDWRHRILLILPENNCDAADVQVCKEAESEFLNHISLAVKLVRNGRMIVQLKSAENTNLARIIAKQERGTFLIQVPLYSPLKWEAEKRKNLDISNEEHMDSWNWWHNLRSANVYRQKVKVVLELHPEEVPSHENIHRWLSEPIEAIIVPTSIFRYDELDYPRLTRSWQRALIFFIRAHVSIIITAEDDECWIEFADYFYEFQSLFTGSDNFGVDYDQSDELTMPLQTVHTDVNAGIYEEFETDNMKYMLFLNAIERALNDRKSELPDIVVFTILGAGRGPLINCIVTAAHSSKCRVRIYAIEKNRFAFWSMNRTIAILWPGQDIHTFCKDMREFDPPEKADIIVSELLGSFGDNELSPECLDCAVKYIKPNGISIPCSTTSFLNPIMAPTYRHKIAQVMKLHGLNATIDFESTFVSIMRQVFPISPPQPLFTFTHPNLSLPADNTRYKSLKFKADIDCVMNGLSGNFEAVLYGDIKLTISLSKFTPGLISWFPILFPFTEPIYIKKGEDIEIHFWRCADSHKVWYEWCCVSPQPSHIHNFRGRSSPIYLH